MTLLIVAKTLFDTDVEADTDEIGQMVTTLVTSFFRNLGPLAQLRLRLPLPSTKRIMAARQRLIDNIDAMIAERRDPERAGAGGEDRGDLLSMLIAAQDHEDENRRMSDKQVRDEVLTLFLAGHETTANALTWSLYLLSQNPAVASLLRTELDHVLAGRHPTYADVEYLPYTRMVLSESIRLYPPAWVIGRLAMEDVEISGYRVPKDSTVMISQWLLHHNERYYPEPFKFDPERWTPENMATRPKMTYIPFGGGARVCIGESFAWMEGILLLATIVQKWDMCLEPGFPVELQPEITLRPRYGMRMKLKKNGKMQKMIEKS
jgi:cytochrome P450